MEATGEARAAGPEKANGPGRSSSFDEVYGAERAAIVRLAALLVGSQALAEELAHDAFVRLFERFDDVDNPAGFLRTVVVRLAVSSQRRHRTELRVVRRVGVDRATRSPRSTRRGTLSGASIPTGAPSCTRHREHLHG